MIYQNPYMTKYFIFLSALLITGCNTSSEFKAGKNNEALLAENYTGSVFKDLKALVWRKPYDTLPLYKVDKHRVHAAELTDHSARTLDSHLDIIDSDRPKILHPNGVCLSGEWRINPDNINNAYTGYFANGSVGLILARVSPFDAVDIDDSPTAKLTAKQYISYGLTGKIFPTQNLSDPTRYRPANFFTQTDLGGQDIANVSHVEMTNAPDVTALKRGVIDGGVEMFAKMGRVFNSVDESVTERQLYEIAELTKPASLRANTPKYLKLVAASTDRNRLGRGDFRKTLLDYIERNKQIAFDIYVANEGSTKTYTPLIQKTMVKDEWLKIGKVTFSDAVASQVCDFNLHFHHPTWRKDRNDPKTKVRQPAPKS